MSTGVQLETVHQSANRSKVIGDWSTVGNCTPVCKQEYSYWRLKYSWKLYTSLQTGVQLLATEVQLETEHQSANRSSYSCRGRNRV